MKSFTSLSFGSQPLKPSSYQIIVEHENLIFPEIFQAIFKSHYLHNTGEAIGFMLSFPTTIAADLDWKPQEALEANVELKALIGWQERNYPQRTYGFNVTQEKASVQEQADNH